MFNTSLNLEPGQGILLGPGGVVIRGLEAGLLPALLSHPSFKGIS